MLETITKAHYYHDVDDGAISVRNQRRERKERT